MHSALPDAVLHPDLRCEVVAVPADLLPPSTPRAGQCIRLADLLDNSDLRGPALAAWQKVLSLAPDLEHAHIRVAQLLLAAGNAKAAEAAAMQALQLVPKSSALYLVAADAVQRQGREYDARRLLDQGLAATGNQDILAGLAAVQDTHSDNAAELYSQLADNPQLSPDQRMHALERGFQVALRDGDMPQARRLADRLQATGHPEFQNMMRAETPSGSETLIPGGRDGLAFIAMSKRGVSSKTFLAEFARALLTNQCTGICFGSDEYKNIIEDYFAAVSQLESMGQRQGDRVALTLSLANSDEVRRTRKILSLLGIELRADGGPVRLQEGVKRREIRKQDMVAALGIDVIGIEKALRAGKPYTLEIDDDRAEVYPNAQVWKDAFPASDRTNFAEAFLHSPQMARLYFSVSEIEEHTLQALFGTVSPNELATHFAVELARFGPAFAVSGNQAVVPGGPRAAPVWKVLAGVSPEEPGAFFRALLDKPQLLEFFYALSELDERHQAFFTDSVDRTQRFFTLSKSLTSEPEFHKEFAVDSTFAKFLRTVPLDDNGHVIFPGSASVWLVAKGTASDHNHVALLAKRASETAAPALEDSVLSHLAETAYDFDGHRNSELDNFLAVSQLNAHFKEPMNEESALLLAQHSGESWPLYVYFTDLPGVNNIGLRNFFSIIDQIRQKPKLIQNLEMGQLYALLGWISILSRSQSLSGDKAVQLFSQFGEAMRSAVSRGSLSAASIGIARSIVTACGSNPDGDLDASVRQCLLAKSIEIGDRRSDDYQRVLVLQKAPSLDALQSIVEAAQRMDAAPESQEPRDRESVFTALRADAKQIAAAVAKLPTVDIPQSVRIGFRERKVIELYDAADIQKQSKELNEAAEAPKPDLREAQKIARELLRAILPQVTAALSAPIYAYYLRSTDLVVSEDPLLLRKHRYVDYTTPSGANQIVAPSEFFSSSEGAGSHFEGGFGSFAQTAGRAAAAGVRQGGQGAEVMIALQIAATRSVPWSLLTEADQRLAALRIRAAREWIVRSASDPAYLAALTSATVGLLSLARRAELLNSIQNRDWATVWNSLPLPDLYMLGSRFSRYSLGQPGSSPVFDELHALEASGQPGNVSYLGHISYRAHGCAHLHTSADAPYEEYAHRLMEMDLAERTADFNLFLAYRADDLGVQPRELGRVAEKLADRAFAAAQLSDYHDWRSLFAAYSSITTNDLKQALQP